MTLFEAVAQTSRQVAATSSRTAKVEAIADLLRAVAPDERAIAADYLAGVLPQGRIGVGWRSLGTDDVAAEQPSLQLQDIDARLTALAAVHGTGSGAKRTELLADLRARLTPDEQTLLRGLLLGDMRQGAGDGIMLKAIAAAAQVKEAEVRRAVMLAGRAGPVAAVALQDGAKGLANVGLEVGRPLRPMLAGSSPEVASAAEWTEPVALDVKLDGIRIQAHKRGDAVRLFTRSLDEVTARLPEVVEMVQTLPARDALLDGEVIALQPDGRPHPFQVTGARTASSADPETLRRQVPVTPLFFDLLHLDGADLHDDTFAQRREQLQRLVPEANLVASLTTADAVAAQRFFDEQVAAGQEGVVVKQLSAPYAAGRRGNGWTKVKPRHTLDLVVLAIEEGSGRRRGFLSNIHLGARDPESGDFVMLGKTFKGMTDAMLKWQTERFTELATSRDDWVVQVRPEQVVEIAFDGLQRSKRYPAGVALRFARVLRYRDDKSAEQADTIADVLRLAQWQGNDTDQET